MGRAGSPSHRSLAASHSPPFQFWLCPHQQTILLGKGEYRNTDFGEVVLVMSVSGQKMIKLNKCSVLSQTQIRSRRAQGSVSTGDWSFCHFCLLWGKWWDIFMWVCFFYFMWVYFFILVCILKFVSLFKQCSTPATGRAAGQLHRLGTRLGNHITRSTSELSKVGKTLRFMNWDFLWVAQVSDLAGYVNSK